MADKTPVRVVFNESNVATGLAEFQSGDAVGVAFGGTGLNAIGSAGQILKVNAAGTALEFGAEGDISITNLVAPTNADLSLTTSGTGNIVLNDLSISDNSISTNRSNDDLKINASGTGTVVLENLKIGTSGSTVTTILDEDNLGSDSATSLATQQSIKAYVDSQLGGADLDFQADSGGALAIDLDSETMTFTGGTGIDTSGSGNTVTFAIDSTVATLTGSQTLTNKVITSPTISGPTITGTATIGAVTTNSISSNGSNADISIQPSGTGDVLISALRVNGTTLDSSDSSKITIAEALDVTGALASSTSLALASGATVTGIADEDNMSSNSDTLLATQQSIKAYVDTQITAEDLDFQADSGGALSIDLDSETMTFTGGTGIDTSGSSNTVTFAIDSTVATLTGSQTLTNKVLTSPTISTPTVTGTLTATSVTTNDIVSNGSNADITIDPTGTGDINLTAGADVNLPANIGLTFGDDGEKIEGDGTDLTISSSGVTTLDSAGNINIDAGGSSINLKDDGTQFGALAKNGNDLRVISSVSDGDIVFRGNDGGGFVNALTLDMSEAGAATFNSSVTVGGAMTATSVTANDFTSNGSNADITIAPQGTGDINLTAGADINIPADIGLTFGNDAEKIEGDGTDLTITGNNIKLTATTDVIIPTNVGLHFTDANEKIESDGSKLVITSGGTAFNLPTADGDDGQALITDGSGTLSFGAVGDLSPSDDTGAIVVSNKRITSTARTIDAFNETWQDSVLYYIVTNDHHLDTVNIEKLSLNHNDTGPFVANGGVQAGTGSMNTYTYESSNNIIRLKAASQNALGANVSFYKFGLGDNSAAGTTGNIITTINADVDSASESLVSFAHATFRGAKLFVSVNNSSKTEVSSFEAFVVHDGTNAFVSQGNVINTGDNDLATLTAAISGSNVVVSAAGLEPNLRISVHAIMLKDTMTADASGYANIETIAPVTITSAATEFDTLEEKTTNGAVYYLVSKNATEGHYAINEIMVAIGSNDITHTNVGFISTKGTNQLAVTTEFKDDTELQGSIKIASTSGSSTTVSAYMIKLHAS